MEVILLFVVFITCLDDLWVTVWSTAAASGSFDGDAVSLSTLKSTQTAVGLICVAGD